MCSTSSQMFQKTIIDIDIDRRGKGRENDQTNVEKVNSEHG